VFFLFLFFCFFAVFVDWSVGKLMGGLVGWLAGQAVG